MNNKWHRGPREVVSSVVKDPASKAPAEKTGNPPLPMPPNPRLSLGRNPTLPRP